MPETPNILDVRKILDNGDEAKRANLVLIAEGYTKAERKLFEGHCRTLVNVIKQEQWYKRMPGALNVHRIMVESKETGRWIPYACPPRPRRTAFKATFCANRSMLRAVGGDMALAQTVAGLHVADVTTTGVLVNHSGKGGTGAHNGFWCTTGRSRWWYVALHELGHGMFGLADEYDGVRGTYTGGREPSAPNITIETDRDKLKWRHLVSPDTPVPTQMHGEPLENTRLRYEVGLFEGGSRFERGVYRPAHNCRMRQSAAGFCDVCEEHIVKFLTPYADEIPEGTGEVAAPTVEVVPDVPEGEETVVRPKARIEVKIGGRTISWIDSRSGTDSAIAYLRRRHP